MAILSSRRARTLWVSFFSAWFYREKRFSVKIGGRRATACPAYEGNTFGGRFGFGRGPGDARAEGSEDRQSCAPCARWPGSFDVFEGCGESRRPGHSAPRGAFAGFKTSGDDGFRDPRAHPRAARIGRHIAHRAKSD